MNKKLIIVFLLILNFLFIETISGQNSINSTFRHLFNNISDYYGNVFLDTSYLMADTSQLKKMYPTELIKELELIKNYEMRICNFSFSDVDQISYKIRTVKEFYKEKNSSIDLSAEDSAMLLNSDNFYTNKAKNFSNKQVSDSFRKIENLLLESTFHQILSDRSQKGKPKYMTLLSIFETEKMYLFIYRFMMLYGYPHYYVKSDLVLK